MTRRFLSAALVSLLLLSLCSGALAQGLVVQPDPDTENFTINPMNPLACLAEGYYSHDIEMDDGTVRTMKHYYPAGLPYRRPVIFVAMPSGGDSATFLVESGWKAIADSWGAVLLLLEAGAQGWQEDELEYTGKVYDFAQARAFYTSDDSAYYLVGYEDAADAVMAEAVLNANNYAGVAALGAQGKVAPAMQLARETDIELADVAPDQSGDPTLGGKISEIPIPVWIGASEKTDAIVTLIEYWKDANGCGDIASSNAYANEIYEPVPYLIKGNNLTYQDLSKVMVTWDKRDYYDTEFVSYLWNEFLCRARRQDSGNVAALRYFATPDELGMDYHTAEVNGVMREFYVFVPDEVKGGELGDVPVVFSFHGGGGAAFEFTSRSGWYKLAEDRNFILVIPQGDRSSQKFAASTGWSNSLDFFKYMHEFVLENYAVDASRVYITGQSAGCAFTFNLAAEYPNLIAAVASCSLVGVYSEVGDAVLFVHDNPNEAYDIPIMVSIGMYDHHFAQTGGANRAKEVFGKYWLTRNGLEASWDSISTYKSWPFTNHIAFTDDGVPMFRWQWVSWKTHATVPDELPSLYEFMSLYSRGDDGALYYMGKAVQ